MKARLPLLLAPLLLLFACATKPAAPLPVPGSRPEITIHAPPERVRLSIITQEKGEGETLVDESESRLSFVRQVSEPKTEVSDALKPSGAPYLRSTYVLAAETQRTHVSLSSEIVSNDGTAAEHARPFDSSSLRRTEQRRLLRLRAVTEKP